MLPQKNPHNRASDKCQREKRKTINGDDLLWAMSTLGFEDYVEPLRLYLLKYREVGCPTRVLCTSTSFVFITEREDCAC